MDFLLNENARKRHLTPPECVADEAPISAEEVLANLRAEIARQNTTIERYELAEQRSRLSANVARRTARRRDRFGEAKKVQEVYFPPNQNMDSGDDSDVSADLLDADDVDGAEVVQPGSRRRREKEVAAIETFMLLILKSILNWPD